MQHKVQNKKDQLLKNDKKNPKKVEIKQGGLLRPIDDPARHAITIGYQSAIAWPLLVYNTHSWVKFYKFKEILQFKT